MRKHLGWAILISAAILAVSVAAYDRQYDHNKDGIIDHEDLLLLQQHWHTEGKPVEEEIIVDIPGLATGAIPLTMVHIPPGTFDMGSPDTERSRNADEGPVHTVTIGYDFYISKYEITQAQWQAVIGANPATGNGEGDDLPVYNVSWNHCQSFTAALTDLGIGLFRLPTEAEWEYACRAGTTTRFYFGDSMSCADDCSNCDAGTLIGNRTTFMWYCGNNADNRDVKIVGQKQPNAFGLHDMSGNVWEWVVDFHHNDYEGAPTDGSAWVVPATYYRAARGGSHANTARYCRSANRSKYYPEEKNDDLGLRVAGIIQASTP